MDVFAKEKKRAEEAGIYEFNKACDKLIRAVEDAASLIENNDKTREYLEETFGYIEYADKFMLAYVGNHFDYTRDGSLEEAIEKYYTSF